MELLMISFATAFNFVILLWKLRHSRYMDTVVDILAMLALAYLFGGTLGGMTVAMMSGSFISLYLLVNPVELPKPRALVTLKTMKRIAIFLSIAIVVALSAYITITLL